MKPEGNRWITVKTHSKSSKVPPTHPPTHWCSCTTSQPCNTVRWTWWDWSLSLGLLLPLVHWHCLLGHLTC